METNVKLDCGVTMNVKYPKYGCLVYIDLYDLAIGSVSLDSNDCTKATIRISVANLPAIKKLVDKLLKDPDVKARIKEMKKSGDH